MKIKLKAAIVLNPREAGILRGVLERVKQHVAKSADPRAEDERQVVEEFIKAHDRIDHILDR